MEMKPQLTRETIRRFHVAHSFEESHKHKKSMSFSRDGQRLVVCDHRNLSIFNCSNCTLICQVHMHPYRPEQVCFGPNADCLLHSATKVRSFPTQLEICPSHLSSPLQMDFAIRYLNLSTRQYVRLFTGHKGHVMNLCLQPDSEHCFVSTGRDKQLLLWDLRTAQPTQHLDEVANPLVAFDPTGKVIATCKTAKCIELYDVRKLEANPCQRFCYQVDSPAKWTQLQFSPDGKALLVATDFSCCFSVDAYNGSIRQAYTGWLNHRHLPLQACYTPDSQFVLAGADRGCVHVWHATSGRTAQVLENSGAHSPIRCLQFHPKQMMFVTCDVITCFWQIKEKWMKKEEQAEEREHRFEPKEIVEQLVKQEEQELKLEKEQEKEQAKIQEVMYEDEKKKRKEKRHKQAKQKEQEEDWSLTDFEEWEQQEKEKELQKMEQDEVHEEIQDEVQKETHEEVQEKRHEEMQEEAHEEVQEKMQQELQEDLQLELQVESQDDWATEQLEQREEQEEQEEQPDERQKEFEQQAQRPKKRLRSVVIIPTIDLTSVRDESSSEEDVEMMEDPKRWLDDGKWLRGKLVRRRIVSYSPRPLELPKPRRRWPVWPRRRSPIEEGELIEDY